MARHKDDLLTSIQRSIEKHWIHTIRDIYPQAPIEEIRIFATRAINSRIKEHERILAMPVEDVTLAHKKLMNSKAHYKVISSNHTKIPDNWRVYIAVISVEEVIKARLIVQGRKIKGHDYLSPLVRTLRWGESKRRIRALEDFANSVGNQLDINANLNALLSELQLLRRTEDRSAMASSKDIKELLQFVTNSKQYLIKYIHNDPLNLKMKSKIPILSREIFHPDANLIRICESHLRYAVNSSLSWYPIDIDVLLLGVVFDAHKNRTRYVDEHDGSIGPERYGRESPLGVVKQFDGLLELLKAIHDRTAQEIKFIREMKLSEE